MEESNRTRSSSNTVKRDSNKKPARTSKSSGGRGKVPRVRSLRGHRRGGNPRKLRNKAWIFRKALSRAKSSSTSDSEIKHLETKIYLDTNDEKKIKNFYDGLVDLLEKIDFEIEEESEAKKGSWWKDLIFRSKRALNSKEVQERLEKIERGLELKHIDKVQSEVDLNTAEAISKLINASKEIPNFSTRVGSLLFAKATVNGQPIVFAQTLTQEQLKIVIDNPTLLGNPAKLINEMEEIKKNILAEKTIKRLAEGE